MRNPILIRNSHKGFTLLEVIIFIVIGGILAAFLVTFMGTAVTQSGVPVHQTRELAEAMGNMEEITAAYEDYLRGGSTDWNGVKSVCGADCSYVTIGSGEDIFLSSKETIQVTVTTGDHQLISYFMEL